MAYPSILSASDTVPFIAKPIVIQASTLLLKPIKDGSEVDISRSLQDIIGLDSLVAIEMRNWWKSTFGCLGDVWLSWRRLGMGIGAGLGGPGLKKRFAEDKQGKRITLRGNGGTCIVLFHNY
jgi:hypothetical protein